MSLTHILTHHIHNKTHTTKHTQLDVRYTSELAYYTDIHLVQMLAFAVFSHGHCVHCEGALTSICVQHVHTVCVYNCLHVCVYVNVYVYVYVNVYVYSVCIDYVYVFCLQMCVECVFVRIS